MASLTLRCTRWFSRYSEAFSGQRVTDHSEHICGTNPSLVIYYISKLFFLKVIRLFCYVSLRYAVAQSNFNVSTYLLRQAHDTEILLRDRKFCFNLMVMGKSHKHKSIEDFVFVSPAPCYTSANLSALYRQSALKEKDRATDLLQVGDLCEELTKDLVSIGMVWSIGTNFFVRFDVGISFVFFKLPI